MIFKKFSIHSRILAMAALSMGFSMMGAAFGFYYVKVFLNLYHIKESWFQVAQTLFMIWNAINDPLFAYLQDSTNFIFTRTRRESVLYAAPLFALSFVVPWFPWGDPATLSSWVTGMHLIVALCFWDTMFTYIGLSYCCLFTEISKDSNERMQIMWYTQIAHLIGSFSVFLLQYLSDQLQNFAVFQTTCVVLAVLSCLLMRYCGHHAHTALEIRQIQDGENGKPQVLKLQQYSYIQLTKQIIMNRDFLAFVTMNFFQEFHRTFMSSFFSIICDQLIPTGVISPFIRSVFYGGRTSIGKIYTIVSVPVVKRYGYFNVIRCSQVFLILLGASYYVVGPINHGVLMLYLVVVSCTTDGIFALFTLPLSDIADRDCARYNRSHPVTSMIYGTNALVVKPAISLSPMFIVWILNKYGYETLIKGTLAEDKVALLKNVMFSLVCMYPLTINCIQLVAWSYFTIRQNKDLDIAMVVRPDFESEELVTDRRSST